MPGGEQPAVRLRELALLQGLCNGFSTIRIPGQGFSRDGRRGDAFATFRLGSCSGLPVARIRACLGLAEEPDPLGATESFPSDRPSADNEPGCPVQ